MIRTSTCRSGTPRVETQHPARYAFAIGGAGAAAVAAAIGAALTPGPDDPLLLAALVSAAGFGTAAGGADVAILQNRRRHRQDPR